MSNHDSIFKATFEQLDLARGELEFVLPAPVLEQLDLATLELRPGYAYLWRTAPLDVAADEVRSSLLQIAGPQGAEDVMNAAEELMERGRAEGLQRGRAEGLRTAIEHLMAVRKLALSELGKARLCACTDVAVLTAWLERAATATSEAEVFAGAEGT